MSLNRTVHIQRLDMRKTPALARAAIDGNADVGTFRKLSNELVEVSVGGVESDVAKE